MTTVPGEADTTQQRLDAARSAAAARKAAAASAGGRRGPMIAVLVIGVGLVAAPFIFQMLAFDNRAPKGGEMIDQFRPYMTTGKIDRFRGYLDEIDAADKAASRLPPSATASGGRSDWVW